MSEATNSIWEDMRAQRARQRFFGYISGIFLAAALIGLFDGLIAVMRSGSNELEMLPGQITAISGPIPLKNPIDSDVVARITPEGAPARFELEGFFTGYWFGSGMWRGRIIVDDYAEAGKYNLRVSFKGAPRQSAQKYVLKIYANSEEMRSASLSLLRSFFNINAFTLAAVCAGIGIICGAITYFYGRRYILLLAAMHLAEIYYSDGAGFWCLAPKDKQIKPGEKRLVVDQNGAGLGEAEVQEWLKGRLRLAMRDGRIAPKGAFVRLQPIEKNSYFPYENKQAL